MKKTAFAIGTVTTIWLLCLTIIPTKTIAEDTKTAANRTYEELYYSRVVTDIGKNTALLKRMSQKDYKTVETVMSASLKGDLEVIESETNRNWSAEQKKAIALAKEYLKQTHD